MWSISVIIALAGWPLFSLGRACIRIAVELNPNRTIRFPISWVMKSPLVKVAASLKPDWPLPGKAENGSLGVELVLLEVPPPNISVTEGIGKPAAWASFANLSKFWKASKIGLRIWFPVPKSSAIITEPPLSMYKIMEIVSVTP